MRIRFKNKSWGPVFVRKGHLLSRDRKVQEIKGLTWKHADLTNSIVRLESSETKDKEGRSVYMDDELKETFKQQWETRKKNRKLTVYVFPNENGTDRIRDFRKAWLTACKEAKSGKRHFHDFRRPAVRNMIRSGIPERVATRTSDYKTSSVFDRYNIVKGADLQLTAQRQQAYLQSQMGTISAQKKGFTKMANPLILFGAGGRN